MIRKVHRIIIAIFFISLNQPTKSMWINWERVYQEGFKKTTFTDRDDLEVFIIPSEKPSWSELIKKHSKETKNKIKEYNNLTDKKIPLEYTILEKAALEDLKNRTQFKHVQDHTIATLSTREASPIKQPYLRSDNVIKPKELGLWQKITNYYNYCRNFSLYSNYNSDYKSHEETGKKFERVATNKFFGWMQSIQCPEYSYHGKDWKTSDIKCAKTAQTECCINYERPGRNTMYYRKEKTLWTKEMNQYWNQKTTFKNWSDLEPRRRQE